MTAGIETGQTPASLPLVNVALSHVGSATLLRHHDPHPFCPGCHYHLGIIHRCHLRQSGHQVVGDVEGDRIDNYLILTTAHGRVEMSEIQKVGNASAVPCRYRS